MIDAGGASDAMVGSSTVFSTTVSEVMNKSDASSRTSKADLAIICDSPPQAVSSESAHAFGISRVHIATFRRLAGHGLKSAGERQQL
jgi:hypothetical protein